MGLSRLSVFAGGGPKMFLRLSLCLVLGLLVSLSSQTCSFKADLSIQDLLEVQYPESKSRRGIPKIQIDSLEIKMKDNQKFSSLVSDACSGQDISTLQYKPDNGGEWESVDLDLETNHLVIGGTDPCKEYQLKI